MDNDLGSKILGVIFMLLGVFCVFVSFVGNGDGNTVMLLIGVGMLVAGYRFFNDLLPGE